MAFEKNRRLLKGHRKGIERVSEMEFAIQHETSTYMRLRLRQGRFTRAEAEVLEYALGNLKGVSRIRMYPTSGSIAFSYEGGDRGRGRILEKLRALQFRNVEMFAHEIDDTIDREELARRKLSPEIKEGLRKKILLETVADILMPLPIQVGYHVYQLVTLRNI